MEKKNYLKCLTAIMLLLASFSMASCESVIDAIFGEVDNPVSQKVVETIVEKTGASAAEVTSLLQAALVTPEVQQAILNNESFSVNVSVPGGSSAAGETITIPVSGGEGKNGANVTINFTNAITGTSESNPLNFSAANVGSAAAGAAGSGNSDNQLTINMPNGSTGLVITIDLPDTTVTLATDGTTVYKSISARTALNTLVVGKGVTVEDFIANGGRVKIMKGGKINRLVFAPRVYHAPPGYHHNELFVDHLGAFGLAIMNVEGDYDNPENWTTFAVQDDGEWYRFENLKILPPKDCDFMAIRAGIGPHGETPNLKSITIADGAAILIDDNGPKFDETGRTIEGENGSGFRYLQTVITGEGNDARLYYGPWMSLGGYKTMTNVKIMPAPDIQIDNLNRDFLNGGWEHLYVNNIQNGCDNCTFYIENISWDKSFLNDHNEITFNNCKFRKVAIESPNVYSYLIGVDLKDLPDIPITISFVNCDFQSGLRFFLKGDDTEVNTFTFKFINCTYNSQPMSSELVGTEVGQLNEPFVIPEWGNHINNHVNTIHHDGGHVYYIIGTTENNAVKYELKEDHSSTNNPPFPLYIEQVDPAPAP